MILIISISFSKQKMLETCCSTLQEGFHSTKHSFKEPKDDANSQGHNQIMQSTAKYTDFLDHQNQLISNLLLGGYKGSEKILNGLQDSTTSFIKSLLEELSDVYSKLRLTKSHNLEENKKLKEDLAHEQEKYEQLKLQFYEGWEENSQKSSVIINFLEKQLKQNANQSEAKIATMLSRLQKKQLQIEELTQEKQMLNIQISDLNRLLRTERESLNDRILECKGLQALVEQYQQTFREYEESLENKNMLTLNLEQKILKLEEYNQDLQKELDEQDEKIIEKNEEIQKTEKQKFQGKVHLEKILCEKEKEIIRLSEGTIDLQDKIEELKMALSSLNEKLKEKETIISLSTERNENYCANFEKLKKNLEDVKNGYETKFLLLQKMMSKKLSSIRNEHEKTKKYVQKQLLLFGKLSRLEARELAP